MKKKGFALIELIVVLVIIGVLAVIIIPVIISACDDESADDTRAIIKLDNGESITVEVDDWYSMNDNQQIKIVADDGTVYYAAPANVTIIKENDDG